MKKYPGNMNEDRYSFQLFHSVTVNSVADSIVSMYRSSSAYPSFITYNYIKKYQRISFKKPITDLCSAVIHSEKLKCVFTVLL